MDGWIVGQRFFVEQPIETDRATLVGPEAHHVKNVMRAAVGDEIVLFDGSGKEFTARIDRLSRADIQLAVINAIEADREPARRIIVGVALPKGDRQRWLVEKLTELGVAQIVPLKTERSVVHPDERGLKKLNRFVIEASKQCGRNRLLQITPIQDLSQFLTSAPTGSIRWFADPCSDSIPGGLFSEDSAYLAVGPEGGFSPCEQDAAMSAGWRQVSLGPRILRIETACLALTTLVSSDLGR